MTERYDVNTAFWGDVACQRNADAFLPAVQSLVLKLILVAEFARLLRFATPEELSAASP